MTARGAACTTAASRRRSLRGNEVVAGTKQLRRAPEKNKGDDHRASHRGEHLECYANGCAGCLRNADVHGTLVVLCVRRHEGGSHTTSLVFWFRLVPGEDSFKIFCSHVLPSDGGVGLHSQARVLAVAFFALPAMTTTHHDRPRRPRKAPLASWFLGTVLRVAVVLVSIRSASAGGRKTKSPAKAVSAQAAIQTVPAGNTVLPPPDPKLSAAAQKTWNSDRTILWAITGNYEPHGTWTV